MNCIKKTHQSLPKNANSSTHKQIDEYIKSHPSNPRDEKTPKLIANLNDKEKYVLHMRNLKVYLIRGLMLKQIHRVIKCKQSRLLKPFIDLNTKLRAEAKTDFEKDLYKLMNNAIFGKTMGNVETHMEYELDVNKKEQYKYYHHNIIKTRIYTMKIW